MAHDPKLEIYKVKLVNREDGRSVRFRESFRGNISSISSLPKPITDEQIYREFYQHFLRGIDLGKFQTNSKKDKAFNIAKEEQPDGSFKSMLSSPTADNFTISGLLQGGKYNIKRSLGDVENTTVSSDISTRNIVCDRFFFLMYAPINHNVGILMIQGYTEIKISDLFREFIADYFKVDKKIDCQLEIFVPESLKNKYLKGAVFSSAKFTSGFIVKGDFDDDDAKDHNIEVKIEITDKSTKKANYKKFESMLKAFGNFVFSISDQTGQSLGKFQKTSAKMKGKGKEFPIDFDAIDNIKPTILLEEQGIQILDGRIPNFGQIEAYCYSLLTDLEIEINPAHAVESL